MPLQLSVSYATIFSVTLESSPMMLEVSFTLTCNVYSTDITYDNHQLIIRIGLLYKPLIATNIVLSFSAGLKYHIWMLDGLFLLLPLTRMTTYG